MSKQTQSKDVFTCDGCGLDTIVEEGDLPNGYHGTAYEVNESTGGGSGAGGWYACKQSCIKAAVIFAAKQGWGTAS